MVIYTNSYNTKLSNKTNTKTFLLRNTTRIKQLYRKVTEIYTIWETRGHVTVCIRKDYTPVLRAFYFGIVYVILAIGYVSFYAAVVFIGYTVTFRRILARVYVQSGVVTRHYPRAARTLLNHPQFDASAQHRALARLPAALTFKSISRS